MPPVPNASLSALRHEHISKAQTAESSMQISFFIFFIKTYLSFVSGYFLLTSHFVPKSKKTFPEFYCIIFPLKSKEIALLRLCFSVKYHQNCCIFAEETLILTYFEAFLPIFPFFIDFVLYYGIIIV